MSFTNLIPLTHSHLLYGQAGKDVLLKDDRDVGGVGYVEYFAGDEAGSNTSADNTSARLYFPNIKYWTALHNLSLNTINGTLVELETMAKSATKDDLSKTGEYDPTSDPSEYFHIYHGDEIFGKFTRVAVYKTTNVGLSGRLLLSRGPSNN